MKYLAMVSFILICCHCSAQRMSGGFVKGILFDSLAGFAIEGASVSMIRAADSALVSYAISDEQGRFTIQLSKQGSYRLLVSHINYQLFNRSFTVRAKDVLVDFGKLMLTSRSIALQEVTVQSELPPVTIKGDTTEFNAGSFKTKPNAAVEELLKKLPGMKVEKDGTIKLNGEKIQNVLVDGKKFFGSNPKTATRNLPADAIDKVQIYDKLSDQAELSGFDDGNGSKTINLTFKKDHKKGSFGKLNAGGGTSDRFAAKGNVNTFRETMQLSFLGALNNVNDDITAVSEIADFSSMQHKMNKGTSNRNTMKLTSDNSIITAGGGGVNYNYSGNAKRDLHSDYLYSYTHPVAETELTRQFFLPDTSWTYHQQQSAANSHTTHMANAVFEQRMKTGGSLKIAIAANRQQVRGFTLTQYQTLEEIGMPANAGFSNNHTQHTAHNSNTDIIYRKRFIRPGRTLSASFTYGSTGLSGTGQQLSENNFYNAAVLSRKDTIDQHSIFNLNTSVYTIRSVYTETVFRSSLLEVSAATSHSASNDKTMVYNANKLSGKYEVLNTGLSNRFKSAYHYYNTGIRLRTQTYKTGIAIGASIQRSGLSSEVIDMSTPALQKVFLNILPNARFKYSFSRYKNITFNYGTSVTAPASYQLQPVIDNSDPLNIKRGNPSLNQEYNHLIQFSFVTAHPYNGNNLRFHIGFTGIQNKITSSDSIDLSGVKKSMPVNINGTYYIFSSLDAGCKVRWLKGYTSVSTYTMFSRNRMLINGTLNDITNFSIGPEWKMTTNPSENLSLGATASLTYNTTLYSIQPAGNMHYTRQQYELNASLELPGKWMLATEFTYIVNNGLTDGYNRSIPLLNASVSKFVLKNNKGELKFSVADAFDRNVSVIRNASENFIEDISNNILRRYFLIGFTYSLSKVGLSTGSAGIKNSF
jgi:hypothetical protein